MVAVGELFLREGPKAIQQRRINPTIQYNTSQNNYFYIKKFENMDKKTYGQKSIYAKLKTKGRVNA